MYTLQTLQLLGLDPASPSARRAIALVAVNGRWEHAGQRYFDGEVEPCINGRDIQTGANFGVDVTTIVERALTERLPDGGWNCEAEKRIGAVLGRHDDQRARRPAGVRATGGSATGGSATGGSATVREGRRSGEEYLLGRGLFRRTSTGAVIQPIPVRSAVRQLFTGTTGRKLDDNPSDHS